MTFIVINEIIISLYNDFICGKRGAVLSDRTKQVQFRMPDELYAELKAALAYDRSSFADFFNKAAEDYLAKRNTEKQKKSKHKYGGAKNG